MNLAKPTRHLVVLCSLCLVLQTLVSEETEFQIIEYDNHQKKYFSNTLKGTECINPNPLNRLSMLSENQLNYPIPESACGPTAMLNILVWYEKFGLIKPLFRDASSRKYKLKLFTEIDLRLAKQSGQFRTEEVGILGVDSAIVMDAIVNDRSEGALRIHTDIIDAPLKLTDIFETTSNFRAGFLVVAPRDRASGKILDDHAVAVIRADRAGFITLGTWGQHYHGLLKKRRDGQWFVPQNPKHLELQIKGLIRFIPFEPEWRMPTSKE